MFLLFIDTTLNKVQLSITKIDLWSQVDAELTLHMSIPSLGNNLRPHIFTRISHRQDTSNSKKTSVISFGDDDLMACPRRKVVLICCIRLFLFQFVECGIKFEHINLLRTKKAKERGFRLGFHHLGYRSCIETTSLGYTLHLHHGTGWSDVRIET